MQFIPNTRLTACIQRSFNFSVAAFRRLGNKLYNNCSSEVRPGADDPPGGELRPGRAGDVVIWDNDPLELGSRPTMVWIDGKAQSLTTRQDRLRERYATPQEGALPKAYDR